MTSIRTKQPHTARTHTHTHTHTHAHTHTHNYTCTAVLRRNRSQHRPVVARAVAGERVEQRLNVAQVHSVLSREEQADLGGICIASSTAIVSKASQSRIRIWVGECALRHTWSVVGGNGTQTEQHAAESRDAATGCVEDIVGEDALVDFRVVDYGFQLNPHGWQVRAAVRGSIRHWLTRAVGVAARRGREGVHAYAIRAAGVDAVAIAVFAGSSR